MERKKQYCLCMYLMWSSMQKFTKKIYGLYKKQKLIRFSMIAGFESNIQKLIVFSYVCNEPREIEF